MRKKIILTGGGSAGHVTVNLALIPKLKEIGYDITYIGSKTGIEKELLSDVDIPYRAITTGKLRRYFDWNNFKDPFKVAKGTFDALAIIRKEKPQVIFSKGGFVSVPVIVAAKLLGIPSIVHESDLTPGLANKIALKFTNKICVTFEDTLKYVPKEKSLYVGAIVREQLKQGEKQKGYEFCGFTNKKPVLLIMGGSLGSKKLNEAIRENISTLLETFQIVHLCGKGNVEATNYPHYKQYEYINDELPHVLAMTDIVVSRAGSNSIFEFLTLKKPMLLIPLSREASRGDQILNANSFKKHGYADVLLEENLTSETFLNKVQQLYERKDQFISKMKTSEEIDALKMLLELIEKVRKK